MLYCADNSGSFSTSKVWLLEEAEASTAAIASAGCFKVNLPHILLFSSAD
jgi:hypothetical protein